MILKGKIIGQINRIRRLGDPVKASLAFTICGIFQKGIGFITTPIFTRLMSTEQYGVYSLYLSWYSIVIILSSLNLSIAYNNVLVNDGESEKSVASSFLGISTTISVFFLIIFCINTDFWTTSLGLSKVIILLMLFQSMLEPAFNIWSARERFFYKYKKLIASTVFITVGSPFLGIIMVLTLEDDALARIVSNFIVMGIIYLFLYIAVFFDGKKFFDKKYWHFGLTMCIPLIPHFLSQVILNQSDRIMISKMLGDDKTAVYSVAYTIVSAVGIIISSINNSLLPYMYKNLKEHKNEMQKRINELLILIGGLCFIIMLLAPEFIGIIGGKKYTEAIWVIPSVAVATYFTFVYSNFSTVELFYEKAIYMAFGSVLAAVINILLNYYFIPIFGYYAAGYTTLVGFVLLTIFHYAIYKKIIKNEKWVKKDIIDISFVSAFSLVMVVLMLLTLFTYKYAIVRYLGVASLLLILFLKRKRIINMLQKG